MRGLIPFALLAVAACGPVAEENATAPASVASATSSAEAEMVAEEQAEAAAFAWTGRFAATPELCVRGVWDIKPHAIVTDGHTACDVDQVAEAAGQVTLRLSCTAEGVFSDETWTLSPRPEDGMRVARDTGRERFDVDLIRCR
jgi:hypothetical protein